MATLNIIISSFLCIKLIRPIVHSTKLKMKLKRERERSKSKISRINIQFQRKTKRERKWLSERWQHILKTTSELRLDTMYPWIINIDGFPLHVR